MSNTPKKSIKPFKTSHLLIENDERVNDLFRRVNPAAAWFCKFLYAGLGRPVDNTFAIQPEHAGLFYQLVNGILPVDGGPGSDDPSWLHPETSYSMLFEAGSQSGKNSNKIEQYQQVKLALLGKKVKGKIVGKKTWDELKAALEALPEHDQVLTLDVCQKYYVSGDLEGLEALALSVKNASRPSMSAGLKLRDLGLLPLDNRGLDKKLWCGILVAVTGALKSWRDRDWACKTEKADLKKAFENALAEIDGALYERFKQFASDLQRQIGYKVEPRVLKTVEKKGISKKGKKKDNSYERVMSVLSQYPDLQEDFEGLGRAYLAEQAYLKRKENARQPVSGETCPLQIPLGLTGNGYPFTLAVAGGRIVATIQFPGDDEVLQLRSSGYFKDLEIEPEHNAEGRLVGYQVAFTRGTTRLTGIVKEPALMRKKNRAYFSLRINMPEVWIPQEVRDTRAYYSSAVGNEKARPTAIKALAIDLGVTTLADYSVIDTGLPGQCRVYGDKTAAFTGHGKIGQCADERLRDRLYKSTEQALFLGKLIRLFKKLRDGETLNAWEVEKLPEYLERLGMVDDVDDYARKDAVRKKFLEIKAEIDKEFADFALRDRPATRQLAGERWEIVSAETVQVLAASKRLQSLSKSWTYYSWTAEDYVLALTSTGPVCIDGEHIKSVMPAGRRSFVPCGKAALLRLVEKGEIVEEAGVYKLGVIKRKRIRRHPENFLAAEIKHFNGLRRDLTNKLVRAVVNKVLAERVQLVIVEDFGITDPDYTKDAYENYRWNLFAPANVVEKLEAALLEIGVAMATVDPRHTSQRVQLTNEWGFRKHGDLFFIKDSRLCRTDANTNASQNIGERFFLRHSELSELRGRKIETEQGTEYLIAASDSKRQCAFLKSQTGKTLAKLVEGEKDFTLVGLTPRQHAEEASRVVKKKEIFYSHGGLWFDAGHHFACRNLLEKKVDQASIGGRVRIKDLTPDFSPKPQGQQQLQSSWSGLFSTGGA